MKPAPAIPANALTLDVRRAVFIYEAARLAAIAADAPVIPEPWGRRDIAFCDQFIAACTRQFGPNAVFSAEELHENWIKEYQALGWTFGPVYDPVAKIHPDLVPFDKLDRRERDKDRIFLRLCDLAYNFIRE